MLHDTFFKYRKAKVTGSTEFKTCERVIAKHYVTPRDESFIEADETGTFTELMKFAKQHNLQKKGLKTRQAIIAYIKDTMKIEGMELEVGKGKQGEAGVFMWTKSEKR